MKPKFNFSIIPKIELVENQNENDSHPYVKLLNCRSRSSILSLYNNNKNNIGKSESLSMYLYAYSTFNDKVDKQSFEELYRSTVDSIGLFKADSLILVISAISKLSEELYEKNLLNTHIQESLLNQLNKTIDEIDFRFYPTIFYLSNILLSSVPELKSFFAKVHAKAVPFFSAYNKEDLFTILNYTADYGLGTRKDHLKLIKQLEHENLKNPEIAHLFFLLKHLSYYEQNVIKSFKEKIDLENLEGNDCAKIINYLTNYEKNKAELTKYLSYLHKGINNISMASYFLVWEALIQSRNEPNTWSHTINLLKMCLEKNDNIILEEFKSSELVKLVSNLHDLRVSDSNFLDILNDFLLDKLPSMNDSDLLELALNYFIYAKMFENVYVRIHNECVVRIGHFTFHEKEALVQKFNRVNHLFPDSPFVTDFV